MSADQHPCPIIIPIWEHGKSLYQETWGKSLLISSLPPSRQKPMLPMLTCRSVWNNGDPRELHPQLKNGIQIFWSMPVMQTLNFAVIVAFYAAAGSGFLAGHHAKHVLSLQAVPPYQMALWPYENTGSIMPQQSCVWQQCHRTTINKSQKPCT